MSWFPFIGEEQKCSLLAGITCHDCRAQWRGVVGGGGSVELTTPCFNTSVIRRQIVALPCCQSVFILYLTLNTMHLSIIIRLFQNSEGRCCVTGICIYSLSSVINGGNIDEKKLYIHIPLHILPRALCKQIRPISFVTHKTDECMVGGVFIDFSNNHIYKYSSLQSAWPTL